MQGTTTIATLVGLSVIVLVVGIAIFDLTGQKLPSSLIHNSFAWGLCKELGVVKKNENLVSVSCNFYGYEFYPPIEEK